MIGFTRRTGLSLLLLLGLLASTVSFAQEAPEEEPEGPAVAAVVNGDPVYVGEVDAGVTDTLKLRQLNREGLEHARAGMLRDIINKRLIEQALEKQGGYVDSAAIDKAMKKLESNLKNKRMTLENFAAQRNVRPETARHELGWPMIWNKYLERNLADELELYFNEHHKDLDGTTVRASHILLRPETAKETKAQVLERAEKIREQIESKKLTFAEAAEKYSIGPSRHQGGDLGFVPRYGVMAEDFSKAAFALDKGEISQPVTTNFGTHLITVTDIKPGSRQWTEIIPQIQSLASKQMFDKLAAEQRATAKIEYTGKSAYFKAGTEDLVMPKGAKP